MKSLTALLAFSYEASLGGARKWLAVFADRAALAALFHKAGPRCTSERLTILADRFHRAGLRQSGTNGERGNQSSKQNALHAFLLF
jgi:hypothetical protein